MAYLIEPTSNTGAASAGLIVAWLGVIGLAVFCWSSLIMSIVQSLKPDHKLPNLLVKSTVFHSGLIAVGVVGILVLKWLRADGLLQIALWCIILLSLEWLVRVRKSAEVEPKEPSKVYMNRVKLSQRKR